MGRDSQPPAARRSQNKESLLRIGQFNLAARPRLFSRFHILERKTGKGAIIKLKSTLECFFLCFFYREIGKNLVEFMLMMKSASGRNIEPTFSIDWSQCLNRVLSSRICHCLSLTLRRRLIHLFHYTYLYRFEVSHLGGERRTEAACSAINIAPYIVRLSQQFAVRFLSIYSDEPIICVSIFSPMRLSWPNQIDIGLN